MCNTRPNIKFVDGVCQPCIDHEKRKKIDWSERWTQLEQLCKKHKEGFRSNGDYNILIPCSGGKDSHWQVYVFKELLGMNPLGFMIDNGPSWTKTGRENFYNMSERYDMDVITFTPSVKEVKKRMLEDFKGELWPEKFWDQILYDIPMEFAKKLGIELVAWGENTNEFIGGENVVLNDAGIDVIYLSDYIPWSRFDNIEYSLKNGFKGIQDEWKRRGLEDFPYEQVDTVGYLVNNYCKFIKFGFSSVTELCADAVREGKMTREEALKLVNEKDWKLDLIMLKDFCDTINISQDAFWKIIDKHANQELLEKRNGWWRLKDDAK